MRNAAARGATKAGFDASSPYYPAEETCMFLAAVEAQSDRAYPRSRVLMTGTLMTPEGAVAVRIRDISVTGAQIWAPCAVPNNCDAILKRGLFFAAARVTRSEDHTAGLQFYRQLSDEEFAAAFQQKASMSAAVA
jgi:hypothetical protein